MKAQGKCTTDHISAAGPWLKYRGHLENISGNLFAGAVNAYTGEAGTGKDVTDGETRAYPDIAKRYHEAGIKWVAIGDRNYGEGSSREHAAMEPRFRGGLVILARSFARIHETNAKKQGLLPLTFADPATYDAIGEDDTINVLGLPPVPGENVRCQIVQARRHDARLRGSPHVQPRAGRVVQGRLGAEHRAPEGRRRRRPDRLVGHRAARTARCVTYGHVGDRRARATEERILVAGSTGYVGGRLVPELLAAGYTVRVVTRSTGRAQRYDWSDDVEVVTGDVLDPASLDRRLRRLLGRVLPRALDGLGRRLRRDRRPRRRQLPRRRRCRRPRADRVPRRHGCRAPNSPPTSRAATRSVRSWRPGSTPTTEFRAAVIIGSGSLSFEMLRYLTEVLPVMVTPKWVDTKCQPIAIRDVLHYLVGVLDDTESVDRVLDIGGPDVLTYAEMMQTYAAVAGLRRRVILPVPVLSPSLSSRWVGLVTPLPSGIARPLIDSLRHEVVMRNHDIDELVPHEPIDFRTAVELAVRRTSTELVVTRWSDPGSRPPTPSPATRNGPAARPSPITRPSRRPRREPTCTRRSLGSAAPTATTSSTGRGGSAV